MSVRYGIGLTPEPAFTARVYRARQLICGQYASWAAEMFAVHLTVANFFQCPERAVEPLDAALAQIARQSRQFHPQFPFFHRGVATYPDVSGNIFLDFATSDGQHPLHLLHRQVIALLKQTPDIAPDLRFSEGNYWPHLTLMQYASLPPPVFAEAVEFARGVVADLQVPSTTRAWRMQLVRFQSEAAGDNWDGGRWAADVRWQTLSSYPL